MTEEQWATALDPAPMLRFVSDRASDRKLRLFSCACCQRAWKFATDERLSEILRVVQWFADGIADARARGRAHKLSSTFTVFGSPEGCIGSELRHASRKKIWPHAARLGELAASAFGWAVRDPGQFFEAKSAERVQQVLLVRDIFGNPFRPVTFNPEWRTSDAMLLAHGIYAEQAFDRMPILADALQDAGCNCDDLLNHLRDPHATHVPGCWAIDLALRKE